MRIKKFLLVVPLLLGIFFVSDTSAFAESDIPDNLKTLISSPSIGRLQEEQRYRVFSLGGADIQGYSYEISLVKSDVEITFNLSNGTKRIEYIPESAVKKKFVPLKLNGVSSVEFRAKSYSGLYVDSFQVYEKMPSPPDEIAELKVQNVTHKSVKFTYKFPKEDFDHVKVFRDDRVIASNVKVENFTDSDLEADKEYKYKFIAVSKRGLESKGTEQKIQTEKAPDLTKPAKPSSPIVTPKDGSLIVNLTNYNAGVKIKGYHIVVDGKQVNDSLVTGRSYAVKGLKNGQAYQVQIKAVSAWNVESDLSNSVPGIPQVQVIPDIAFNFGLTDLIESIKNWFGGIWPIVAFSIAIPLAFIVAFNTKKLFLR
ncbi:TPA: fibronectin type III domain-containing protein [Bacillus cereus]|nr:fibronectin type III domain-containing protein [Bacillus cereus]